MTHKRCPDCGAEGGRVMAEDFHGTWSCYCYDCKATWQVKRNVVWGEASVEAQPNNASHPSYGGRVLPKKVEGS